MKRKLIYATAIAILLLGIASVAMAAQIAELTGMPEWPTMALDGEGIWAIEGGQAQYYLNYEGAPQTVALEGTVEATGADASGLYVYPNDPEHPALRLLSKSGEQLSEWPLPEAWVVRHIVPMGDQIVLLTSDPADDVDNPYHGHDLRLMNRSDGKVGEPLAQMVMDAAPTEDGQLLVMYWDEYYSTATDLLNPANGAREQIQDGRGGNYEGLSYAGPGKVYLASYDVVFEHDTKTGQRTEVYEAGEGYWGNPVLKGPILASYSEGEVVHVHDLTKQPVTDTTLTVVNNDLQWTQLRAVKNWFKQHHPNVQIKTVELGYEQLNVAMMAQQSDLDVLNLYVEQYDAMAKQGALMDLEQSASIQESLEQWMPGVCDPLRIEGKLYALPLYLTGDMFILDGPLYRASGLDWPTDRQLSWLELADMADAIGLGQAGKPPLFSDDLFYPWSMWQYVSLQAFQQEIINFDTPLFRELMEAHKRMVISGALIQYDWDAPRGGTVAALGSWYMARDEDAERRLLPTLDGEQVIPSQPAMLALNRSSANAELAMLFMERYAMPQTQNVEYYVNFDNLFLKDISGYRKEAYDNEQEYTAEDLAYRETMFSHWVPQKFYYDLREYCAEGVMTDYLEGRIDVEQLIQLLQTKIDMMQME